MNFTSHPEVLIAPRAPIDPERTWTLLRPTQEGSREQPREGQGKITALRRENQQKAATTVVDPLLFHAFSFSRARRLL
jgi:hypothetical protein